MDDADLLQVVLLREGHHLSERRVIDAVRDQLQVDWARANHQVQLWIELGYLTRTDPTPSGSCWLAVGQIKPGSLGDPPTR